MPVQWETTRINAWHIGAAILALVANAFAFGGIYVTMNSNDDDNAKGLIALQTRMSAVEQKIPQFEVIALQIQRLTEISAQNTQGVTEANKRMDRIVESLNGKLDVIVKGVADLTTEVRVVQSLQRRSEDQRTSFPIVRP